MRTLALAAVLTATLAACGDPAAPTAVPAESPRLATAQNGDVIPGHFIVVLKSEVTDVPGLARRLAAQNGGTLGHLYQRALKGFSVAMSDRAAAALARSPFVAFVEPDRVVTASTTQSSATWGIDRVDQRALPLSGTYSYTNTGAGVTAYIIDTGILFSHTEFGGRAVTGVDEVTAGGTAVDCNGHGTHVSGTVGGATYGIAKQAKLVAVRVLDCGGSGSNSGVIAGVDWVTSDHQPGQPAVANMSLGGSASTALDNAVKNSIADGVVYAIAAGNGFFGFAQPACNYSPARVPEAITVSATDNTDKKASYANYGTCVDIFAPGNNITSAWYTNDTATNTISGTSMATPHVTGVAALYLQSNPAATPQQVRDALVANGTTGKVTSAGSGSPNVLLFTNY